MRPVFPPVRYCRSGVRLLSMVVLWLYHSAAPAGLFAQQPTGPGFTLPAPSPDSLAVFFLYPHAPEERYSKEDTLPDVRFRMYDPARQFPVDWGTLGNLGSSARPLWFSPADRQGFDMGIHPFDLYRLRPDSLRFFDNSRTFSEVFFSQGRTQNDNMVRAVLSRTFGDDGITFALDYRAFNNLGQYRYQTAKHSAVSGGIRWPVTKRYQVFLVFTSNSGRQQENGGIATDTLFGSGQFEGPIAAPIRLPDQRAQSRIADRTWYGTQHLDIGKFGKRVFRARHTLSSSRQEFKFFDTDLQSDSLFFDTFYVDSRGLRHYTSLYRLDNEVELLTFRQKTPGKAADLLGAGLSHTYFRLQQEPRDSAFSNVFLHGRLTLAPGGRFAFQARGALGMLTNFGEYRLEAALRLSAGKLGQLDLAFQSQRYPPAQLYQELYVSRRNIWTNDFKKPVETSLSARYTLPSLGIFLSGQTHLVNNYLYFDQRGIAAQTSAPLQVVQFMGGLALPLGVFHFDNTAGIQQANRSDVFRLPTWFAKSSLYYSGAVFKKRMDLQAGFDFRINSEFRPEGYQPLSWQFHLQDTVSQRPYPWLDVFVAFKVQSFRFFFRYENISTLWDGSSVFYQTAYYAQPLASIRFGIGWRFLDGNQAGPQSAGGGGRTGPPPGVRG